MPLFAPAQGVVLCPAHKKTVLAQVRDLLALYTFRRMQALAPACEAAETRGAGAAPQAAAGNPGRQLLALSLQLMRLHAGALGARQARGGCCDAEAGCKAVVRFVKRDGAGEGGGGGAATGTEQGQGPAYRFLDPATKEQAPALAAYAQARRRGAAYSGVHAFAGHTKLGCGESAGGGGGTLLR